MEDRPPLLKSNKVYSLTPKFITDLVAYYRKIRLKRYKHKKIKQAKTDFNRNYHIKFKIKLNDSVNPQISDLEYIMIISSPSAFYAKKQLIKDVKNKVSVDIVNWEEITDDELEEYNQSKEEYIKERYK